MKKEVLDKLTALITAAFGLVAALAWNEAIQAVFKEVFGKAGTIWAMIMYAILVTVIAVWATMKIASINEKADKISEKLGKEVKKKVKEVNKHAKKITTKLEKNVKKNVISKIKIK